MHGKLPQMRMSESACGRQLGLDGADSGNKLFDIPFKLSNPVVGLGLQVGDSRSDPLEVLTDLVCVHGVCLTV